MLNPTVTLMPYSTTLLMDAVTLGPARWISYPIGMAVTRARFLVLRLPSAVM
jgi:hypothetical protein